MTLPDAIKLLCEKEIKYLYLDGTIWGDNIVVRSNTLQDYARHFDLKTIDGCVALGRELGLDEVTGEEKDIEDILCDRFYAGNLFLLTLSDFQSALAAGIEHLYGEKP